MLLYFSRYLCTVVSLLRSSGSVTFHISIFFSEIVGENGTNLGKNVALLAFNIWDFHFIQNSTWMPSQLSYIMLSDRLKFQKKIKETYKFVWWNCYNVEMFLIWPSNKLVVLFVSWKSKIDTITGQSFNITELYSKDIFKLFSETTELLKANFAGMFLQWTLTICFVFVLIRNSRWTIWKNGKLIFSETMSLNWTQTMQNNHWMIPNKIFIKYMYVHQICMQRKRHMWKCIVTRH